MLRRVRTVEWGVSGMQRFAADPRTTFADEKAIDLHKASVGVLGCGSVGSFAAWALASSGVGQLPLADHDCLSRDNLRRHVCGSDGVERPKTQGLRQELVDHFPGLDVVPHQFCFLKDPDKLRRLVAECDVVLVGIDREEPKYLLDQMLWSAWRPAVFAGVYGGGWGAELILVDPSAGTACYGCAANALGRFGVPGGATDGRPAYALAPAAGSRRANGNGRARRRETPSARSANGWPSADLSSIMPAAALGANLVVAWLQSQQGHGQRLREFRQQEQASVWQLAVRRVPAWSSGPWHLQPVPVFGNTACPQRCSARAVA